MIESEEEGRSEASKELRVESGRGSAVHLEWSNPTGVRLTFELRHIDEARDILRLLNDSRRTPDGFVRAEYWEDGSFIFTYDDGRSVFADDVQFRIGEPGDK